MNEPSGYWVRRGNVWHADSNDTSWSTLCGWHYGYGYFRTHSATRWITKDSRQTPKRKCRECARLVTAYEVAAAMGVTS